MPSIVSARAIWVRTKFRPPVSISTPCLATVSNRPSDAPSGPGSRHAQIRHRTRDPRCRQLTAQELKAISQKSCGVLGALGPQIQWQHSYVTGDKIYCVYIAPNEAMVREHARQGGFPANRVSEVTGVIDPTTAE